MQHGTRQQQRIHRMDQALQFHTTRADPLRQGRPRDRKSCSLKDAFLTVERRVIQVFSDQDLR